MSTQTPGPTRARVLAASVTMPKPKATPKTRAVPRAPLSRARIIEAALQVVDRDGVDALAMRAVAAALGVEAMSLYRHVTDKDDLTTGIADLILSYVEMPRPGTPWREAMRSRARSARQVFLAHPAAAIIVESCATMTPARLAYADAIIGLLMASGFDASLAYRAFLVLDSYLYGFTMQELSWPRPTGPHDVPTPIAVPPTQFPHFAKVMTAVMSRVGARGLAQSYTDEFEFGLELVLQSLEQALTAQRRTKKRT